MKTTRSTPSTSIQDTHSLENNEHNKYSGARKTINVGQNLQPIQLANGTFTTSATTAQNIGNGKNIAVYNSGASLGSINFGTSVSIASLAAGVTDANGNAGLPCPPGQWSYFSNYDQVCVVSSAATIIVFIIADDTYLITNITR